MSALLTYLRKNALHRGLFGGSRPWMVVGGAAWAIQFAKKAMAKVPETVYEAELEPGQTLVITHEPTPPPRRRRRRRS